MLGKSNLLWVGALCAGAAATVLVSSVLVAGSFSDAARRVVEARRAFARPLPVADTDLESDAVWRLGRKLFFDGVLSASGQLSCSSCHRPDSSFTDHLPRAIGEAHEPLAFRAPTLLNAALIDRYGWVGKFPDIEAVTFFAMTSPKNMNVSLEQLLQRLEARQDYVADFKEAFPSGGGIDKHKVGTAMARFVRSIHSDVSPFDRWLAGNRTAISPAAARGFALFAGKARCSGCHSGWTFTDGSFHDIGIGQGDDRGRGTLFKSSVKLQYAFKTPSLRNVAGRAPYMHNGSLPTLEAVVDHYNKGGIDRPSRAVGIAPLNLSDEEKKDLVSFLKTLSSDPVYYLDPDKS